MDGSVVTSSPRPSPARAFAFVWTSWRGLTVGQLRMALLAGLLLGSVQGVGVSMLDESVWWKVVLTEFYPSTIQAVLLLLFLAVAANVTTTRVPKWVPFIAAATLATVLVAGLQMALPYLVASLGESTSPMTPMTLLNYIWVGFPVMLLMGIFAALGYMHWLDATRRTAVLRTLQLERTHAARQAYEARLQALQARVEPRFLFEALSAIETLYESHPGLAQRVLDDLIAYLRAALPALDEPSSSLVTELRLVRTWLDSMRIRSGDRLSYSIADPESAQDARMPPMVLLPLVQLAVESRAHAAHAGQAVAVSARVDKHRLRVVVTASAPAFPATIAERATAPIRERLNALYGTRSSLAFHSIDPGQSQAVLEIPHEPSERHHR